MYFVILKNDKFIFEIKYTKNVIKIFKYALVVITPIKKQISINNKYIGNFDILIITIYLNKFIVSILCIELLYIIASKV